MVVWSVVLKAKRIEAPAPAISYSPDRLRQSSGEINIPGLDVGRIRNDLIGVARCITTPFSRDTALTETLTGCPFKSGADVVSKARRAGGRRVGIAGILFQMLRGPVLKW